MRSSKKEQEVHLSHSQVEEFTQCPRRYHLHRRLGMPPEFVPSGLLFGSALHESLALVHQRRLEGKEATLQEACRAFRARWKRERLAVRCAPAETEKSLREMARRMLSCYLGRHQPAGRVLGVEEPFRLDLSARIPPVHGRIDLAESAPDGRIVVTDFKSAGTRKAPDPAQLVLYREAVRAFSADPEVKVSARFVVLLKTKEPDVVVHEPQIGPGDLQSLIGRYEEVWQAIQSGCSFPVTGWWCGGCQWAGHCDAS